jgi:hypothetical protein
LTSCLPGLPQPELNRRCFQFSESPNLLVFAENNFHFIVPEGTPRAYNRQREDNGLRDSIVLPRKIPYHGFTGMKVLYNIKRKARVYLSSHTPHIQSTSAHQAIYNRVLII